MNTLLPFVTSFLLPGVGQLILKDYLKGVLILVLWLISSSLVFRLDFLSIIPIWAPYVIFMIWAIFDVYDKIEERDGRKSATRNLAFSIIIVLILIPMALSLLFTGLFKGGELFVDEYLNEDRTKVEMNEISTELGAYKNHLGIYPENYDVFISQKPLRAGWKADSWKNPYKYELLDSLNYRLISTGKDGVYNNEDDIIRRN